jgi:hypothetical protein
MVDGHEQYNESLAPQDFLFSDPSSPKGAGEPDQKQETD